MLFRPVFSLMVTFTFLLHVEAQYNRKDKKGYEYFLEEHDKRNLHFGIIFAAARDNLNINYSNLFSTNDSIRSIRFGYAGGATASTLANYIFENRFVSLKFAPGVTLHFWQANITFKGGKTRSIDFNNSQIDIPIWFKYRSVRRKNHNLYLLMGLNYSTVVGKLKQFRGFTFRRNMLQISYGVGLSIYTRYTRFAPEIRFSHSLFSVAKPAPNSFIANQIRSLIVHSIGFYLNFGG